MRDHLAEPSDGLQPANDVHPADDALDRLQAELDAFSYAISHDLRAPIRHLEGFVRILLLDLVELAGPDDVDPRIRHSAERIGDAARQLREMVEGLLQLSRTSRAEVDPQPVDLAELARDVALRLTHEADRTTPQRAGPVEFVVPQRLPVQGDPKLLRSMLQQLLANAWKFTAQVPLPRVELGFDHGEYFVRDNGVGFEPGGVQRLFGAFQRLHRQEDFPGLGMGLVTAQRIVAKHGGTMRATGLPDHGATISFTLPS